MAPGAVTHSTNMTQRHVELAIEATGPGGLSLRAPDHGDLAPPGYYMLFVLDDAGVPSVARWVQLYGPPARSPVPVLEPVPDAVTAPPDGAALHDPPPPVAPGPQRSSRDGTPPKARLRIAAGAARTLARTGRATLSLTLGERARTTADLRAGRLLARRSLMLDRGVRRLTLRVAKSKLRRLRGRRLRLTVTVSDAARNTRRLTATLRLPTRRRGGCAGAGPPSCAAARRATR
jgi:hypothetical protein